MQDTALRILDIVDFFVAHTLALIRTNLFREKKMFMIIILLFVMSSSNLYSSPFHIEENQHRTSTCQKKAIIIGASVGMGKELSKRLAADGYSVGMTARRIELLEEIQQQIPTPTYIAYMDASQPEEAITILTNLITEMGGLDLLVIAATGFWDCDFDDTDWKKSLPVLTVDVIGFFALARTGLNYFEEQGYGHLVGFSSIDGLYGVASSQAYSAAKAFCSRYLQGRKK